MLILSLYFFFFFFNDTATTEIYTLSLHDALPIFTGRPVKWVGDRREDLLTSTQAWDETIDAELAVDADGTIHALRARVVRSEEHTSELQSRLHLVCRLLLEKKKKKKEKDKSRQNQ